MLRKLSVAVATLLVSTVSVFAQNGSIKGTIEDADLGGGLPFVNVVVLMNGEQIAGASTDFDGKYTISALPPGTYDLQAEFIGYSAYKVSGVIVKADKITFHDFSMSEGAISLDEVEVIAYSVPLIDKDGGASGGTVTREDIEKMPQRSATGFATTVGGVYQDAGSQGALSVRGSRSDATYYYIDGIKVRGSTSLPKSAIEQVSVLTGGVPANYGDATGGIISITTRGPSKVYFGGFEYVTSGFQTGAYSSVGLDHYGYNLVEGVISGPLFWQKDENGEKTNPLMGFFVSGNFTHQLDSRPFAIDQYKLKDEVKQEIIASPLRPTGLGFGAFYNTDFVTEDDFESVPFRLNGGGMSANVSAKIDVNAGDNVNLTFGGQFVFNESDIYSRGNSMFNWDNSGMNRNITWRAYGRFTQRFNSAVGEEGEGSGSKIKNAYYTVMVDYSKSTSLTQSRKHKDSLFNYGYLGKFDVYTQPSYEWDAAQNMWVHNGFDDTLVTFQPSAVNYEMASITTQYFSLYDDVAGNYENFTQLLDGNAPINGMSGQSVYGIWANIGTNYGSYGYSDANQFRVTGSGSADVGDHAITVGFEYEQRTDRAYSVGGLISTGIGNLWYLTYQLVNSHIQELDLSSGVITNNGTDFYVTYDRLNAIDAQSYIDYNLRTELGLDPGGTDWIDVMSLDPSILRLEMYSADELLNQGSSYISYYGYNYDGSKQTGKPAFDDFFNERDEFGNYTRPVAPFEPIYMAGFIMDKFAFDDIIFNVGVRVDRFDANQMVLDDKYLLFPAYTADEVAQFGAHPENIPGEATVYVNDLYNPTAINGYRFEDTWYTADGVEVSEPSSIKTGSGIAPLLLDPSDDMVSSNAFVDYKPQINVMPRIAFSFPISDEALFFAHYDVLTKRPGTGNRLDPMDYFFLENGNRGLINNPNLRPEKTIDYELGFQQVLSKSSSLKLSLFYREQRDQIQVIKVLGSYPRDYDSYGNIDFGTVKGLTVQYDLRRTGNVTLRASYTLQFAEGTGSGPTAGINLVNSGQPNLRTIFPYSFDQRHALVLSMDYRYGGGEDYNGPIAFGKPILANTGLNVQARYGSGTPYSAQANITPAVLGGANTIMEGTLNGSRKPSQFRIDLQLDRDFQLQWGGGEEGNPKTANMNVYLLVNNVLNTQNITNVYAATGNPDDDGYLAAADFQSNIAQQNSEESYRYLYGVAVNNPWNYGIPRTIRLGVKLDF